MKRTILYIAGLSLLLAAGPVHAELTNKNLPDREGVKLGHSIFHAAYKQEEQFDSNIFLTDSDTKFDTVTLLNPSFGIDLPLRDNIISADYDCDLNFFGKYQKQDHIDHRGRALAEFNFTDYKFITKDVYRHFTDRSGSENTARVKRQTNEFKTDVSAEFELLGFDVGYINRIEDYLSNEIIYQSLTYEDKSTVMNIVTAQASYRFMPKTLFLLESDLGFVHYYNSSASPDSWYNETVAGIKGEWFKKINVNFYAGFRYQDYDKSDIIDSKDFIGPVLRGGFDYYVTDDDTLGVRLERSIYESTYNNMNYYNVNLLSIDYIHKFSEKLSVTASGLYQINLYPGQSTENGVTAKRYDNFFGGGCGVRYDIRKWLSVEAKYEYKQRLSRFDVFDYIDNLVTLRGTVGF